MLSLKIFHNLCSKQHLPFSEKLENVKTAQQRKPQISGLMKNASMPEKN